MNNVIDCPKTKKIQEEINVFSDSVTWFPTNASSKPDMSAAGF